MVDLKAIRERAEKARKGPWAVGNVRGERDMIVTESEPFRQHRGLDDVEYAKRRIVASGWDDGSVVADDADIEFIAAAREDVPALLGLVDELTRAALSLESRTAPGFGGYASTSCCDTIGHWDKDLKRGVLTHAPTCLVDAALTAAGLDTAEKRDAAREAAK